MGDRLDDGLRVGDRQLDADVRVREMEPQSEQGHDGGAGPRRCADCQLAAEPAVGVPGHFLDELLLEGQEPLCAAIEASAGFGGSDSSP